MAREAPRRLPGLKPSTSSSLVLPTTRTKAWRDSEALTCMHTLDTSRGFKTALVFQTACALKSVCSLWQGCCGRAPWQRRGLRCALTMRRRLPAATRREEASGRAGSSVYEAASSRAACAGVDEKPREGEDGRC